MMPAVGTVADECGFGKGSYATTFLYKQGVGSRCYGSVGNGDEIHARGGKTCGIVVVVALKGMEGEAIGFAVSGNKAYSRHIIQLHNPHAQI